MLLNACLRPALASRAHLFSRCVSTTPPPKNILGQNDVFREGQPKLDTVSSLDPPPSTDILYSVLNSIPDQNTDDHIVSLTNRKWRIFRNGEVVTPKELTPEKCAVDRRRTYRPTDPPPVPVARYNDFFRQLNMDPLDFALNPSVLSNYISEMGKIFPRSTTGLTARNQRRLGKAIRRARSIGVLPQLCRPPDGWVRRDGYSKRS